MRLCHLSTCNLNQWSLDFDLNLHNILQSITLSKQRGCTFRTGPELEICGYSCEDHYYENDTVDHSWQSIGKILQSGITDGILCDIGTLVIHDGVRYNVRIWILNSEILLIRPKMILANDGNYRELRWFTPWSKGYVVEDFTLPTSLFQITKQRVVPIGPVLLSLVDTIIGSESCEELFSPLSPHVSAYLNGAEILANGSGSHHQIRKLDTRLSLIRNATSKGGGVYLYSNQQGCDGGRLYFDGSANIHCNGDMVGIGSQFSIYDVEIVTAIVDLDEIISYRGSIVSRGIQAGEVGEIIPKIKVNFSICHGNQYINMELSNHISTLIPSPSLPSPLLLPEQEIAYGPACWLWDYLRRSGGGGFFLPLSGGADSAATATLVSSMCRMVVIGCKEKKDEMTIREMRRVVGEGKDSDYIPKDHRELCRRILSTCYMGTTNSSEETRGRAKTLSDEIGSYHLDIQIDTLISSALSIIGMLTNGILPKYKVHGGSNAENLSLQNVQARMRMVMAYLLAQLLPWIRGKQQGTNGKSVGGGFLIVLGSANVDESLRGYMTKYDCSSADINPIGGISKQDINNFLLWATKEMELPTLLRIVNAAPTAELEPITKDYKQNDEDDMGMSYEELGIYGKLRKIYRCGPVSMYRKLLSTWGGEKKENGSASNSGNGSKSSGSRGLSPLVIAKKVKDFFTFYAINRHKLTTLTPSYHAENYSPEDNRFDHRPFLYNTKWTRQFKDIEEMAEKIVKEGAERERKKEEEEKAGNSKL